MQDAVTKIVLPRRLKHNSVPSVFPWTVKAVKPDIPVLDPNTVSATYNKPVLPTAFVGVTPTPSVKPLASDVEDPLQSRVKIKQEDNEESYQMLGCVDTSLGNNGITETDNATIEIKLEPIEYEKESENTELPCQSILKSEKGLFEVVEKVSKSDKGTQAEDRARGFSVQTYKNCDKAIHFYTGLESFKIFNLVYSTLGENVAKLGYYYGQAPKNTISPMDQFFLTLIILRRHITFEEISYMFLTTITQVYNIFITWIRFMASQWRLLDLWVDKETVQTIVQTHASDDRNKNSKHTESICTLRSMEFPLQKPSLQEAEKCTHSALKDRNTMKAIIGIAPSGLITYISPCYGGSVTDRQIIERSALLDKLEFGYVISVENNSNFQGLFIRNGERCGVIVNNNCHRKGKIKSVEDEVIHRLNGFKILQQPLKNTEAKLSSDIVFIIAMLINFRTNI
ncbi:DDE superfamily endonuclease domain-containing protein [Phthorimaea operculella]|nr:DDE superfamily endonuclease domain-containing protein [Phthorimaea operculella]